MKLHLKERFFTKDILKHLKFDLRKLLKKDYCNEQCPYLDRCCDYHKGLKCNIGQ